MDRSIAGKNRLGFARHIECSIADTGSTRQLLNSVDKVPRGRGGLPAQAVKRTSSED